MQVYIGGIGVVSGIGQNVEENLASLRKGKHGMAPVTLFETVHQVPVCEVKLTNKQLKQQLELPLAQTISRTALLGMLAVREALADAQININNPSLRVGLISSTSVGGMDLSECFYPAFRANPLAGRLRQVASHDCGDSTERIAAFTGIKGLVTTVSTACSSAANAIMLGARLIKYGQLDLVVAGGSDALCKFTLNGFSSLMILDKDLCRPFDDTRAGLNLGEGAGYVVLQSAATLQRTPYCTLQGYANANDAYHQTASSPEGNGPYQAMSEALLMSKLSPDQISYINVHGTGTPNNDASESMALLRLFGNNVPAFSSTKSFTGHTLGAAGGIEAVYAVLSLQKGILYPNLNFTLPIKETGLVPQTTYQEGCSVDAVMSNSFGFGGNNTTLVFANNSE